MAINDSMTKRELITANFAANTAKGVLTGAAAKPKIY